MPPRKKKIKAVLYLYEDQVKKLKSMAVEKDEPVSKLIRDAVAEYLVKHFLQS
jgi:hypothetical protein